jgi:hypothetical protein
MKSFSWFFIVFGLVVSFGGCSKKVVPFSIIKTDSIRIDTITKSDTIYMVDPLFINSLFECDSTGEIQRLKLINWSAKFDSLKQISPLVRTVVKTKKEAIYITKKEPGEIRYTEKKVYYNTVTVILSIVCFILFFCLCLLTYMFYRYTKK